MPLQAVWHLPLTAPGPQPPSIVTDPLVRQWIPCEAMASMHQRHELQAMDSGERASGSRSSGAGRAACIKLMPIVRLESSIPRHDVLMTPLCPTRTFWPCQGLAGRDPIQGR